MGKKDSKKKAMKALKTLIAHRKKNRRRILKKGFKEKCCRDFKISEKNRCKRCPCYDLIKQIA